MDCVRPESLTAPAKVVCAVHFGQIGRMAIGRRGAFAAAFATLAAMKTQAAWNPAIVATDSEKIILTPVFAEFQIPQSEAQFAGENSNESIGGKGFMTGYNAVKPTGSFIGLPGSIRTQLQLIEEESRAELGNDPLEVGFITPDSRIITKNVAGGGVQGIPFSNFYLQSVGSEGFRALNKNGFGLSLDGQWDKDIVVTQVDFDLLTLYPQVA